MAPVAPKIRGTQPGNMATDGAPNVWNALCRANIENWKRDNPGKSKDAVTQLEAMWSESPRNPNSDVSATPAQIAKKKISKVADSSRPSGSETVSVTNTVPIIPNDIASLVFLPTHPDFHIGADDFPEALPLPRSVTHLLPKLRAVLPTPSAQDHDTLAYIGLSYALYLLAQTHGVSVAHAAQAYVRVHDLRLADIFLRQMRGISSRYILEMLRLEDEEDAFLLTDHSTLVAPPAPNVADSGSTPAAALLAVAPPAAPATLDVSTPAPRERKRKHKHTSKTTADSSTASAPAPTPATPLPPAEPPKKRRKEKANPTGDRTPSPTPPPPPPPPPPVEPPQKKRKKNKLADPPSPEAATASAPPEPVTPQPRTKNTKKRDAAEAETDQRAQDKKVKRRKQGGGLQ